MRKMNQVFSCRNGETDSPSERGKYWFRGHLASETVDRQGEVCVKLDPIAGVMLWPKFIKGWFSPNGMVGQWWGPIDSTDPLHAHTLFVTEVRDNWGVVWTTNEDGTITHFREYGQYPTQAQA